ncbi:MAG TPA: cupin domain-containing protein [Chryseolinea sp.]
MKTTLLIVLLCVLHESQAQTTTIASGIYPWKSSRGPHEPVLKGTTTFLQPFEVSIETLKPGEKRTNDAAHSGMEELLIVKEGDLTATVGDMTKSIGGGSIVFVTPGQKYNCENKSNSPVVFYNLKYQAKGGADLARGKSSGDSFMVDWDELSFKKTDVGGRRDFFNKPTATCARFEMHVTTLNEGLPSHAPHEHAEEEIILLMKGNATMNVDGKDYPMAPGDFVFAASHDFHGIRNSGKGQCEYFAFQWK